MCHPPLTPATNKIPKWMYQMGPWAPSLRHRCFTFQRSDQGYAAPAYGNRRNYRLLQSLWLGFLLVHSVLQSFMAPFIIVISIAVVQKVYFICTEWLPRQRSWGGCLSCKWKTEQMKILTNHSCFGVTDHRAWTMHVHGNTSAGAWEGGSRWPWGCAAPLCAHLHCLCHSSPESCHQCLEQLARGLFRRTSQWSSEVKPSSMPHSLLLSQGAL